VPATSSCLPACGTTAVTTDIPGSAGQSAYTTTTANFTVPAIAATVVVAVANSDWMAVGQPVFASDGVDWGHFEVSAINSAISVTLEFLGQTNDASPGAVIGSGAKVVAGGTQQNIADPLAIGDGGTGQITAPLALDALLSSAPLPIANGGTAGATKSAAIAALGVGQDATVDTGTGIAYDVTASPAQITGMAATCAATGLYLILARVTVLYTGVTFTPNRTLTITVRNATAGSNLVSTARDTLTPTTTGYPSQDYVLPFFTASLTASDSIQLWISLDATESAGSTVVTAANICLVPIAI